MFGKAIIATLLGAGVTGGAVYLAANPELLDANAGAPAVVSNDVNTETVTTEDAEAPQVIQDSTRHSDHDDANAHEHESAQIMHTADNAEEDMPEDVVATVPETIADHLPVLPEAKQLTTRTEINPVDSNAENILDETYHEATDKADVAVQTTNDEDTAVSRSIAQTDFSRIIEQADRMASVDLRDQAYLSATEFALSNDNYAGADEAMANLSQPQLRDTARSKIAVKYAQSGETEAAFQVIDQVEIDDLRDFMRLQVIEAITRKQ